MKRICGLLLTLALVLGLCACGQKAETTPTWQEQYDLGVKYLSEGNYQEAIIAFTAAIEIDPKQPEAYIGLADVYTAQGDTDAAKKALEDGLAATGDDSVRARLEQLEAQLSAAAIPQVGPAVDPLPVARTERTDGDTFSYVFEYDEKDNLVHYLVYKKGILVEEITYLYDAAGLRVSSNHTSWDSQGALYLYQYDEYDGLGRVIKEETEYVFDVVNGPYSTGATHRYNGALVELTCYGTEQDGSTYSWAGSYTMTDPLNKVRITPVKPGENGTCSYVGVREDSWETNKEVAHAAFDGAGSPIPWEEN